MENAAKLNREARRKVLLACGILSSLLYVAMNILGAMQYEGYRIAAHTISELSAIGAPSRPFWIALGILYNALVIAFGLGVWLSAGGKRALRVVGGLLVAYGAIGLPWILFAPMHLRGEALTLTDTMNIVFTMATVGIILAAMGFGASAFGKRFRLSSILTMGLLLVFGILSAFDAPRMAANQPTPLVGVWERINLGLFLLWVVVLAVVLMRRKKAQEPLPSPGGAERVKKVTVFVGSARKRGATSSAARLFLDNLESYGDIQGEIVFLGDFDLGLCRGCKACFMRGEERCPLKGDRDALVEKMTASDGVGFADLEPWRDSTKEARLTPSGTPALRRPLRQRAARPG